MITNIENLGEPMVHMFNAIKRIMDEYGDIKAIYQFI